MNFAIIKCLTDFFSKMFHELAYTINRLMAYIIQYKCSNLKNKTDKNKMVLGNCWYTNRKPNHRL